MLVEDCGHGIWNMGETATPSVSRGNVKSFCDRQSKWLIHNYFRFDRSTALVPETERVVNIRP